MRGELAIQLRLLSRLSCGLSCGRVHAAVGPLEKLRGELGGHQQGHQQAAQAFPQHARLLQHSPGVCRKCFVRGPAHKETFLLTRPFCLDSFAHRGRSITTIRNSLLCREGGGYAGEDADGILTTASGHRA